MIPEILAIKGTRLCFSLALSLLLATSCSNDPPCDCNAVENPIKKAAIEESLSNLENNRLSEDTINWIVANSVDRDLKDIREEGVLRALINYNSTSYFIYRGEPMGFEYELLTQLADHLGVRLELVISTNLDNEFEVLNRGDVDIIAHGMTVTNERKWEVDFTEYLYLTRQVLVQKKPDSYASMKYGELQRALIHDPIELINDTVSIRRNSAYSERMRSLSNEIGGTIFIDTLDSRLSTDEIIKLVLEGKIKYTIADENIAKINAAYHPILKVDVPVSFSQRKAWVTRKKSVELRKAVNDWILSERKRTDYNVTYNKYFKSARNFTSRAKSDFYSLENRQISKYDPLIKKYAGQIGWDWRLLASQIYQESRFDPHARSWAGAEGLMQVMPRTAKSYGATNLKNPTQNIRTGTQYLQWLSERFVNVSDSLTRVKFILAAYNCGYGHMQDAQRLATQKGLDPNRWDGHVDQMILALSEPKNFNKPIIEHGYVRGEEPVNYVIEILERYELYKQYIPYE